MNLVDTHCHLTHELFKKDFDKVIERAKEGGVKAILVSGVNPPTNREILDLAKKYPIIKASLGIYPIDALGLAADETGLLKHTGKIDIDSEFDFFNKHKNAIVAIGEVGLDYKYGFEYKEEQQKNFQKIIDLTKKLDKPIVVHTRKAEQDCVDMLESSSIKNVVLHSFEAKKKLIRKASDLGFYFSVPTNIVRAQQFQTLVKIVPLTQIFTETDAPWLGPFKDQRNEPANVIESIKKIAEIKGMKPVDVAEQVWDNFKRIFL